MILWRRAWKPTPVFLPGKSHGQRSLAGYSPWGCKELDTTEQLTLSLWRKGKVHTQGGWCPRKNGLVTRDSCKHHKPEEKRKNFPLEASKDSTGPTKTWFQTSSLWVWAVGGGGGRISICLEWFGSWYIVQQPQDTNTIPPSAVYTVDQPPLKSSSIFDFKVIMTIWPFPQFSTNTLFSSYSWDVFYFSCSQISYSKIHCFLKYWKWKWSCSVMSDSLDCSLPGSSVHGIFQARILEWVSIFFSRRSSLTQGSNLGLLHCRQTLYCLSQILPIWLSISNFYYSCSLSLICHPKKIKLFFVKYFVFHLSAVIHILYLFSEYSYIYYLF